MCCSNLLSTVSYLVLCFMFYNYYYNYNKINFLKYSSIGSNFTIYNFIIKLLLQLYYTVIRSLSIISKYVCI